MNVEECAERFDGSRIEYTDEERSVWKTLFERQVDLIRGRGCAQHLVFLALLGMHADEIPQLGEINARLHPLSGWRMCGVDAMLPFDSFFGMLRDKLFPAATFMRTPAELDFADRPDLFHEAFGHAPLLIHQGYSHFSQLVGQVGVGRNPEFQQCLAAIYWHTCEAGVVRDAQGVTRVYGASAMSSAREIVHVSNLSDDAFLPFNLQEMAHAEFKYDHIPSRYYSIPDLNFLCELSVECLEREIRAALRSESWRVPVPELSKRFARSDASPPKHQSSLDG